MKNDKSRDQIEQVKNTLDIVSVIEKTITLHSQGNGIYRGATSPLSKSGTSLFVDRAKGVYDDKSSRVKSGDVYNWLAYVNNLDIKADFPQILRMAADMAGIQLEEMTEEQKAFAEKRRLIQDILTQAAEVYHSNLTPDVREYIHNKWGITDETIDRLKIGYAKISEKEINCNLGKIADCEEWLETGLFSVKKLEPPVNGCEQAAYEVFKGRVVFPYWNGGKVVNFAARGDFNAPINTANKPWEKNEKGELIKYRKLYTHNEKHSYVAKCVNNGYIWGEDTVRGQKFCVITEGIADAIILMQNNYPVLSPVTTKFAGHDREILISAAKRLETIYICNDNEDSGAGEDGAIRTGLMLKNEGVDVRIVTLPREGESKVDVAEYFLKHTKEDFEVVLADSVDVLTHLLRKVKPSEKTDKAAAKNENIAAAKKFIVNTLSQIKTVEDAKLFIFNDLKHYFAPKLLNSDCQILFNLYQKNKSVDKDSQADNEVFDLDSVSGRNHIYRRFADEYINAHHVKCINGKLRVYKDGIYPESDEEISQVQKDIMEIGLSHNVNLSESNISAIIKLIEISTCVKLEDCEPDKDKVLVVNNGILDMSTWELKSFDPEKIYLSKLPVDYDPNAKPPVRFLKYLETTFAGNERQKDLFQEMVGYTLMKNYKYQVYFYLLGPGGNGKGAAIATIRNLLGEHNVSSESLFQLSDHQHVDYHVAKLYGKHANLCGDIGCKKIENTETIKKATSNTDPITARNPGERPFDFINYAKMIFAMNRLPQTEAFTTGDKRRICLIYFNNKFSYTAKEVNAIQDVFKNEGELPGILLWAIEGLKRLEANGKFSDSRTIAQKGEEYERKSKPVRYFVEECLEEDPGYITPNCNVYDAYSKFYLRNGAAELSQDEIKNALIRECIEAGWIVNNKLIRVSSLPELMQKNLKNLGIDQKSIRCFIGIKIVDEDPQKKINEYNATASNISASKSGVTELAENQG